MKALSATALHADPLDEICEPAALAIPPTLERKNAGGAKAAAPADGDTLVRDTLVALGQAQVKMHERIEQIHEHFKQANDESLDQKAKKGSDDVVTRDKVDRINGALDDATDRAARIRRDAALKAARPGMGVRTETPEAKSKRFKAEWKAATEHYMRTGDETQIRAYQQKAMSAGSNADGGYTVFAEEEKSILDQLLREMSPMRQLATVRSVSTLEYTKLYGIGGVASGWVDETAARPQTNASQLAKMNFKNFELYAMPAATRQLLDDTETNLETWHAQEVTEKFAQDEGTAFFAGNGTTQPKGLLTYTAVANGSWSHGNLGYVATGAAGAFGANPHDNLIDLTMSLKAGFRNSAKFVMNRTTMGIVRKVKDSTGQYLWQPSVQADTPSLLVGYPVVEAEDMPSVAANSLSIAFGDFARGYLITDRRGVDVLRDPYSAKPYILFYTTKRVGGGMQNFECIKVLKFAAS